MDSSRQKLSRANRHLQALDRAVKRFGDSEPYALVFSVVKESGGTYGVIKIKILKPVPDSLGLIVGDVCNNLHSALDHLSWQLWLKVDHVFNSAVHFPICANKRWFDQQAPKNIEGLPAQEQKLIESLQPYKRGNRLLSILRELNITEKHRLIPVVVSQAQITILSFEGRLNLRIPPGKSFEIPGRTTTPIQDGAEVWRVEVGEGVTTDDLRVRAGFAFEFKFDGIPAIASKECVTKTLRSVRDEVRYVLDQF